MSDKERGRRSSVNSVKTSDEDKRRKLSQLDKEEDTESESKPADGKPAEESKQADEIPAEESKQGDETPAEESKPADTSQSESVGSPAVASSERRSSRIMTRRQRDSELRLSFAKKLKTTPGGSPKNLPKKIPVKYSDLTSDSEPTSSRKVVKKPLLGKRKSNLEFAKSQKRPRPDDTTTDDNEDTEESDHKSKPNKRPLVNQISKAKLVKKYDDDTEESDSKKKPVKKVLSSKPPVKSKKVITISDEETDFESPVKKPMNAKVAQLVRKKKDDFSDEWDSFESDSDALESDLKRAIRRKFPSFKNETITPNRTLNNSLNSSRSSAVNRSVVNSLKKPTPLKRPPPGKMPVSKAPNRNASNLTVYSTNGRTSTTDKARPGLAQKPFTIQQKPNSVQKPNIIQKSTSWSRMKSDFDKLVDDLFKEDATRKRKEPELMIINNEPTDVYTLSIDDTLEEDDDLENLGALCEEVEEDVLEPATDAYGSSTTPKIIDINKPPQAITISALRKETYKPEIKPRRPAAPTLVQKTKTLVISKTSSGGMSQIRSKPNSRPSIPSTTLNRSTSLTPNSKSTPNSKPTSLSQTEARQPKVVLTNNTPSPDYREKYHKLQTSYEALSKKIAQYMDKTNAEKEALRRQLRVERSKCKKTQEDLEILQRKLQYVLKNRTKEKS